MSKDEKKRINITINRELIKYVNSHFKEPGTKWNLSGFIESCVRTRVKKSIKPEDLLKTEINFHGDKMKFHSDMVAELTKNLKIMEGELKVVPTKVFNEHKSNSDRLTSYKKEEKQKVAEILSHAPLASEVRKDGTTVGQDISKESMRKKALEIIESQSQE